MTGTCAEVLKTVITGYDWTGTDYGATPETAIRGIDPLDQYTPNSHIFLTDDGEEPEFTVNDVYLQSPKFCLLELIEINATKRTNLYEGLKLCFQASTYSIQFSTVKPTNLRQPYQISFRVRMML